MPFLEFEVICDDCKEELETRVLNDNVYVEPCKKCGEEKYNEGRSDGDSECFNRCLNGGEANDESSTD